MLGNARRLQILTAAYLTVSSSERKTFRIINQDTRDLLSRVSIRSLGYKASKSQLTVQLIRARQLSAREMKEGGWRDPINSSPLTPLDIKYLPKANSTRSLSRLQATVLAGRIFISRFWLALGCAQFELQNAMVSVYALLWYVLVNYTL